MARTLSTRLRAPDWRSTEGPDGHLSCTPTACLSGRGRTRSCSGWIPASEGVRNFVVVCGTGLVGAKVVNRLRDHGIEVRVAARRTSVNAYTAQGLAESLTGAHVVIGPTNMSWSPYDDDSRRCPQDPHSLATVRATGVGHHVILSALGADDIDSRYVRGEAAQERLVPAAPVPHSVLRTSIPEDVTHPRGTCVDPALGPRSRLAGAAGGRDGGPISPQGHRARHARPRPIRQHDDFDRRCGILGQVGPTVHLGQPG